MGLDRQLASSFGCWSFLRLLHICVPRISHACDDKALRRGGSHGSGYPGSSLIREEAKITARLQKYVVV